LGSGKNEKNRRDVHRSPSSVLREEHEKLKSRPWQRPEVRGGEVRGQKSKKIIERTRLRERGDDELGLGFGV